MASHKKTKKKFSNKLKKNEKYVIVGAHRCRYCRKAINILKVHKAPFIFVDIDKNKDIVKDFFIHFMPKDFKTIPIVFKMQIPKFIGGFTDLQSII